MIDEQLIITLLLRGGLILIAALILTSVVLRRTKASAARWAWTSIFAVLLILPASLWWQPFEVLIESEKSDAVAEQGPAVEKLMEPAIASTVPVPGPFDGLNDPSIEPAKPAEVVPIDFEPAAIEATQAGATRVIPWWFFFAWVAGAALILLYILCGHFFLWRLVRGGRPEDGSWRDECQSIAAELGLSRAPRVLVVERIRVPTTAGILRPRILIPPAALEFSARNRRATLVHELTHVRGRDPFCILLAQLVLAMHWCNPLAWIGLRSLRLAQERHCDDAAVACGTESAGEYADLLLRIASGGRNHFPASAGLALSMAQRSSLGKRIRLILDKSMKRDKLTLTQKIAFASTVTCLAAPLALTGIGFTTAQAEPTEAPIGILVGEAEGELAPPPSYLETMLGMVKIPVIDFEEATLEEGTAYLRMKTTELFPDQDPINLVILKSAKGADPYSSREFDHESLKKNQKARIEALKKKMREIEAKHGVIEDKAAMQRLTVAAAKLEDSRTKLETLKDMSAAEIAATFPEASFLHKAVEKQLEYEDGYTAEMKDKAILEVQKRRDEYLEAVSKSLIVQTRAFERLSVEAAETRRRALDYAEVEGEYRAAIEGLKLLNIAGPESAENSPGLITLQLKNISLGAALKYMAQQAGVEMSIQPEAVVFGSRGEIEALGGKSEGGEAPPLTSAELTPPEDAGESVEATEPPIAIWDRDPSDAYLSGYILVQEGERHEEEGNLAGALSSFTEAHRVFEALQKHAPDFEPKMREYRRRKIAEAIERLEKANGAVEGDAE